MSADHIVSPRSSSPTEGAIKAAEELELEEVDVSEDVSDALTDNTTESGPQVADKPSPSVSQLKTPSKVKAAAALWETPTIRTSPSASTRLSPNASFRSIPASSSNEALETAKMSPRDKSPARSVDKRTPSSSSTAILHDQPTSLQAYSTPGPSRESFSEVTLDDTASDSHSAETSSGPRGFALTTVPAPAELSLLLPEPVTTPPARETPVSKGSFFSSTLGFGFPVSSPGGSSIPANSSSQQPSRSTSTSSATASGWRSTVSNLLGNRSQSPSMTLQTAPLNAEDQESVGPKRQQSQNASSSFILQHIDSPTASRDRRISREMGATERLREGFERVRIEMEGAARDMRREEAASGEISPLDMSGGVDWAFWGAVVQDYEDVARTRPKELSKAIQQGIPAVIRGAIWQLMSSSKSAPLEETYKALLKLPSPHEKAIIKDLSRTFPNHKYFREGGGMGQESLFMVVKAYSLYDQEVGYTQGLAFIVAALLLNMPDEEAFCVLVRLMDSYNLRSHFLADMPGLQLRLFQFDRLVEDILPLTHTHFMKKGIKSSMFASQWFMTLFSYRFPLSLVYRVLDIVFAEGVEAIFRFSLALLQKSEDKLVELEFEQILAWLQTDLFEIYRVGDSSQEETIQDGEEAWRANDFVRDAYDVRITPFMLDSYESEYDERCREQNKHALELDQLRNANRNLSVQVKQLESSLATINQEHVELVRQLVMSKIEKEETENELVRYKMLYAELAHAQQDALSNHNRFSGGSTHKTGQGPV